MSTLTVGLYLLLAWIVFKLFKMGRRGPHLPPGPPTRPIIGNLHIFPTVDAHYQFSEWARKYGDIISLMISSDVVIVITSMKAVKELMDQQSAITSDRPASFMIDAITDGNHLALARYSDVWRSQRRAAHAILTPNAVVSHQPIQTAESTQLMFDLLKTPEDFHDHIRRYSASVIVSVVFGKRCPRYTTPEVTAMFKAQEILDKCFEPGAHPPVDALPFLNYIPERWAPWKRMAKDAKRAQQSLYFGLLKECEDRLQRGDENGCYMEEVIKRRIEYGITREMVGYLGGVLLEGGGHTTTAFLCSFILLMTAFPDVQRKAQQEIDRVIGEYRTPHIDDIANLPYCQAVIKEVHRFRPIAPLALPHAMSAQGTYRDYVLPAGATVFVNTWGIYHDPDLFEDPEIFNPDRYLLNPHGTKPGVDTSDFRDTLMFGSARRICPGMHIANNSVGLNVMSLLWSFEFSPSKDPKTHSPIPVDVSASAYAKGTFSHPQPYTCSIKPRSAAKAGIIETEYIAAADAFAKYEQEMHPDDKEWLAQTRGR